jgi:hypothetical protein
MVANEKALADWTGQPNSFITDEGLRAGLALLWRAYICAQVTGADKWDLAFRAGRLYEAGMTSSDVRWMIARGFAEHREETPGYDETQRPFRRTNGYFLNEHTCLILTPSGAALAEHVFLETTQWPPSTLSAAVAADKSVAATARRTAYETNKPTTDTLRPCWNPIRRELSLAGLIVKRFRVPARNQETILSVFEEEGWAEHIHDPLPVTQDIDAPTRLHDAINRLNRCQINPLVRFHGDGKGTGVFWELTQPSESCKPGTGSRAFGPTDIVGNDNS